MKKSKVTIIYPGISWCGFGSYGKKNCPECSFLNHGIGSIISFLKKNKVEVDYLDLRSLKNWKDLKDEIKKRNNRIFGISSTTVDFGLSIKIAKYIKKASRSNVVVVGGVHPTIAPKDALKEKSFDYVVKGEGEKAILRIVESIKKGKKIERYIVGERLETDEMSWIDREALNFKNGEMVVPFVVDMEVPFATILSSRGCPFHCTFCQPAELNVFGGKVRLRPIDDVVNEIKSLIEKYNIKSLLIHDDLFLISKDRTEDFIKKIKKEKIKIKFMCQARADILVGMEEQLKKLKEIGLVGVMVGFESGSQKILDFIKKQTTVENNINTGKICKKLGIKIWANYMLGIPGENYFDMLKTLAMIRLINPEYCSPSLFTPYPGTDLYEYCKKNDLLIFKHYEQYRRSLSGDKIKGFNYLIIRLLILIFLPFKEQVKTLKFILNKFFG